MGPPLLTVAISPLLASSWRSVLLEPVLASVAAFLFAALLVLGRQRSDLLQGRDLWRWALYLAALAGLLVTAVALVHDWLYPSQAFRAVAIGIGLTALVLGLPIWLWYTLRGTDRTGVLADFESRGLTGRSIPSLIALCWCGTVAVWYGHFSSGSSVSAVTGVALLAVAAFGILMVTTETLAQPRFMVPVVLRAQPGRLEAWLARRDRRKSRAQAGREARPKHRLAVPELVTVIVESAGQAGWKAWSTDLDDLKAEAASLAELDVLTSRQVEARFANPGGGVHHLCLQYLVESGKAESPSMIRRQGVLFDVSPVDGGYAAQSVDEVGERYQGKTLEDLIRTVAATGLRDARYTWRRDIEL